MRLRLRPPGAGENHFASGAATLKAMKPKARSEIVIRLPEGWSKAAFVGGEYAFLGWLLPVAVGLLAYVAEASNPYLEGAKWSQAVSVASDYWRLAYAGSAPFAGGRLTLIPLALPMAMLALLSHAIKTQVSGWAKIFVALGHVPVVFLLNALTGGGLSGAMATTALAVCALAAALASPWKKGLPAHIQAGVRFAERMLAILAGASLGLFALALVLHWHEVAGIYSLLGGGVIGAFVVTAIWVGYLPNLCVWALSWVIGAGFEAADGVASSPFSVARLPLPAIPPYAAIPGRAPGAVVLVATALFFVLAGFLLARGTPTRSRKERIEFLIAGVGSLAVAVLVLGALSRGSLGAGRMAEVGPPLGALAAWLCLCALVPAALGAYFAAPAARAELSRLLGATATESKKQNEQYPPSNGEKAGSHTVPGTGAVPEGKAETSRAGSSSHKRLRLVVDKNGDPEAPTTAIARKQK